MGWVELLEVFLAFDGWKLWRHGRLGQRVAWPAAMMVVALLGAMPWLMALFAAAHRALPPAGRGEGRRGAARGGAVERRRQGTGARGQASLSSSGAVARSPTGSSNVSGLVDPVPAACARTSSSARPRRRSASAPSERGSG
jgi:hypothetical protein